MHIKTILKREKILNIFAISVMIALFCLAALRVIAPLYAFGGVLLWMTVILGRIEKFLNGHMIEYDVLHTNCDGGVWHFLIGATRSTSIRIKQNPFASFWMKASPKGKWRLPGSFPIQHRIGCQPGKRKMTFSNPPLKEESPIPGLLSYPEKTSFSPALHTHFPPDIKSKNPSR